MARSLRSSAPGFDGNRLGFDLNALLPPNYSGNLVDEGVSMLQAALRGLKNSFVVGDLQRGCRFHTAALKRCLGYKHELSDADRAECIYILYDLVTADVEIELTLRVRWASTLTFLLRRAKHLTLSLPWRPMFECLVKHTRSKLRIAAYVNRAVVQSHSHMLARAAAQCRRHFPAGTSAELLEAITPMLCPKDPQVVLWSRG